MTGLLIGLMVLGVMVGVEVAVGILWLASKLDWLKAVLVPWMVEIRKLIEGKK